MRRRVIILVCELILVSVGVHFARYVILHRLPVTDLPISQVSTAASQSLTVASGANPIVGKNYTINSVNYFDNGSWAIVNVQPINNYASPATIIMRKQADSYRTVLGPGSNFSSNSVQNLPTPVLYYLNSHSLVSDSTTAAGL